MDLTCARKYDFYVFDLVNDRAKACCKSYFYDVGRTSENLSEILKDRKRLRSGVRISNCENCWALEKNQFKSFRTTTPYRPSSMEAPEEHRPHLIEFLIGNLCNLRCIYCNVEFSSQWDDKNEARDKRRMNSVPHSVTEFLDQRWTGIGIFNVVGGEPSISPVTEDLMNVLLEYEKKQRSSSKKRIKIVSNLAAIDRQFSKFTEMLETMSPFFQIEIGVSAEALGERFEYIRDGASFDQFKSNLERVLKMPSIDLTLQSAINVLALPKYHEFLIFYLDLCDFHDKSIHLNYNEVVFPESLSPRHFQGPLTKEKLQIISRLRAIPQSRVRFMAHFRNYVDSLTRLYDSFDSDSVLSETSGNSNQGMDSGPTSKLSSMGTYLDSREPARINPLKWREVFPELAI